MTKGRRLIGIVGMLLAWSAAACGEDLESVQTKLMEAWSKQKSLTAKLTTVTRMELGGVSVHGSGEGSYELLRQGDKVLLRMELKSTMLQKQADEETTLEQEMLMISDGEFAHTLTEALGEKRVVKTRVVPFQTGDVRLLPETTVNNRKAYVVEVKLRKSTPGTAAKQILSFDQESGFLMKLEGLNADDVSLSSMTYSDIQLDTPITPARFVFTVPPGAEVYDDTVPPTAASQPTSASQPAASQPASAPRP